MVGKYNIIIELLNLDLVSPLHLRIAILHKALRCPKNGLYSVNSRYSTSLCKMISYVYYLLLTPL